MTTFNELYGIVQKNHNFPIVSIKCEEIEIKAEEPFDAGCLFVTDLQSSCDQTQNHETEMKFESFQDEVAQILMLAKTCKLETKKSNKFKRPPNKVDKDEDYCPGRNIENLQLPCQICKRKFVSESTYQRHVDEAHLGKLYCEKCKFLSTPETYNRHMELHKLDGQEFQCLLCKKRNYTSYYQLKNHMRKCWGKPPKKPKEHFLCDFCPFTSLRKVSFASHIERHKANRIVESGGGIECPKCHKKYGTKSILQQHIKTHGKTLHVCEICSKETSHISAHMRMHTNERVQCPICGNMLKNGPAFKRHLLKHEDKAEGRTFPCKECDFRSNSRAGVWNHMNNMHRLKRTLQCHYCPKKLKLPLDLKEHEATHTVRHKILTNFT